VVKWLERLSQGYSQHEVPTKLQARSTAIDCYHFIIDLCTNAGIISEVHGKKEEQLDALQKIDGKRKNRSNRRKRKSRRIRNYKQSIFVGST
jgi:hypothetical protein